MVVGLGVCEWVGSGMDILQGKGREGWCDESSVAVGCRQDIAVDFEDRNIYPIIESAVRSHV